MTIWFGSLENSNAENFVFYGLIIRTLQGFLCAVIFTTSYSIFAFLYHGRQLAMVNSFYKTTIGIGNLIGLFIGTFLQKHGFFFSFGSFGVMLLVYSPLIWLLLPNDIDNFKTKQE